jgi:beta-galactosidase
MQRAGFIFPFFILLALNAGAQKIYSLDASKVSTAVKSGYFKMGNAGSVDKQLLVNSRYLTIGDIPQISVMGELQYSRMPKERWEDEILKMKAGGVNVIATYSFWNHHEEIEGQFDWQGNKDLRSFIKLCRRLGVLVYPRIGPWSHGEARNGGTPDWILRKKYLTDRSIDPVYQQYVERYFKEIGLQLKGLMYKDGGPVAGIQLENEYWKGKAGEPYIYWLKQTAIKYWMDVPLYTVTGWDGGSVPENEVIPLWGGYPDESWTPDINKITSCDNYHFSSFRDDETIGNAQVKKKDKYDYSLDPYFTCEMGVGIFNSIHRQPVLGKLDGLGMIMSRIGSGGNLLGYYVFAGGSNPLGIYSTMQEDKDETGYWSELSPIS